MVININSSQSNSPIAPVSIIVRPITQGQTNPNDKVGTGNQKSTPLIYPSDRPKYFLRMDIMNYSRANLNTVGTLQPASGAAYRDGNSIILPLAHRHEDIHHIRWDQNELGFQAGAITNSIGNLLSRPDRTTAALSGSGAALGAGLSALPGGFQSGAEALIGLSPNKFMTVLFIGPTYKRHSFQWSLSPKNRAEAETIRKIVKTPTPLAAG